MQNKKSKKTKNKQQHKINPVDEKHQCFVTIMY